MRHHVLPLLLLVACATVTPSPTDATLRFAVKGVAIGSPLSVALRSFGHPIKSESGVDEETGQGEWQELTYEGLEVGVTKPRPPNVGAVLSEPYVWRLVLSDAKWSFANGVRVGSSRADVIAILGEPASVDQQATEEVLFYSLRDFDAWIRIVLENGVVKKASIQEDWT